MTDDLETRLRDLFTGGVSLDVDVPPGTAGHILDGARRARRRTATVRAVSAVAAVAAMGSALVMSQHVDRGSRVVPAPPLQPVDPRCQEYWSPPTPSPGEPDEPFDYPTWTGVENPPFYEADQLDHTSVPSMTGNPVPMRGRHGGVLCTVVGDDVMVLAREGWGWPTDQPVPKYSMIPGASEGVWNSPGVRRSPVPVDSGPRDPLMPPGQPTATPTTEPTEPTGTP